MKFTLTYLNKTRTFTKPVRLIDLIDDKHHRYICAKINHGQIRELANTINEDATIEFLTIKDSDAIETYRNSLSYLVAMAFYRIYPKYRLHFTYSASRSLEIRIADSWRALTPTMLHRLEKEMRNLIKRDLPFTRLRLTHEEVAKIYQQFNLLDKLAILPYRPERLAHLYECGGYYNYFNGYMVYSTGYIQQFKLLNIHNRILVQYPRAENSGEIPVYQKSRLYLKALGESEKWSQEMDVRTIAKINEKFTSKENTIDFINACEARHSRQIVELGDKIEKRGKLIQLICIAGPSSSGKTTFANRLRIELISRGIIPTMISLDNYYRAKKDLPLNEKGEPDFECLEALNINLFNQQMLDLVNGKEIKMPVYQFNTGRDAQFKSIKLNQGKHVIIIEGIHALNEKLTNKIARKHKFKIYISPQVQVNIDHDNPVSSTDLRLLRRITRDFQFRSTTALRTIKMWEDVRVGEFKYVYQGIEEADFVFNSFSFFELSSYKKYTLPLLLEISRNEKLYPVVERLIRMLKFFRTFAECYIPNNSIIREFIGGSCFN